MGMCLLNNNCITHDTLFNLREGFVDTSVVFPLLLGGIMV